MAKKHPLTPWKHPATQVLSGVFWPCLISRLVRSGPINNPLILVNTGKSILGIYPYGTGPVQYGSPDLDTLDFITRSD